jgi:DNA repair exonuclease SbcCD ATPase subunit
MENLKERESLSSKRYSSSLLLKQSILEAESIAVTNIVNNINTNASIFLEHFFPVNPIVVNIVCFKEVKNNSKPQLNVEVLYKDMMCDLSTLSGGELSRVILAFTLSLADLYQSPLLLLDETTASLDEELTTIVFETIKEHFRNIPILSISHQCTEGIFDTVLKIQ